MKLITSTAVLFLAMSQALLAQDATSDDAAFSEADVGAPAVEQTSGDLSISLNAVDTTANGCKLTFLIENGLPQTVESLKAEVALFDPDGVVDRLTMLDFLTLPAGKKRVRQFELPGEGCDQLGGLLLNDIKVCEAGDADCMANLTTSSKAGIPFEG